MCKLKDLEDECKGIIPNAGSQTSGNGTTTISNRTASSSMSGTHGGAGFFNGQGPNQSGYSNNKNNSEFLVFKNIDAK
jgi:hypothetical protein